MKSNEIIQVGNIYPTKTRANPNQGRVYDPEGIAPTLNCKGGGNLEPFILIRCNTKAGVEKAELGDYVNLEYPNSKTRRGRVGKQICQTITASQSGGVMVMKPKILIGSTQKNAYVGNGEISSTLTEAMGMGGGQVPMIGETELAIRKLTPKECFRLMGFDDEDVDVLIKNGISNTQLYKMAGNSIVVPMLEYLFCQIFDDQNEIWV